MLKYMINMVNIDGQSTCLHFKKRYVILTKCDVHVNDLIAVTV